MKKILYRAFIKSVPVLIGYIFLGMAYGVLMAQAGFNVWLTGLFSLSIYAGSLQFALVTLLTEKTSLIIIALTCFLINFRHIFYGISFIEEFKKMKKSRGYMIFGLTDETYSVLVGTKPEIDLNEKSDIDLFFYITLFNHIYWIIGSILGCLIGELIPYDFAGVDFAMTALFIVILLGMYKGLKGFISGFIGLGSGIVSLLVFGRDNFLLPAIIITVFLIVCKNTLFKKEIKEANDGL